MQENQWGYRKGLSTESLLLYLTETWKANLDKGKVVSVIFIDFRKAFDCVDHEILGFKMQGCGISENLSVWLKDYLNNRKQCVEINGEKSKLLIVEYGVPQGSLFCPRLFLIYVNDQARSITTGELHLYADDTTAYVIRNSVEDVIELLNTQFCRIKGCGGAGWPPPPPIIFERLKLPQQIIYRQKGNLSESPNHKKYWENILVSQFYERF